MTLCSTTAKRATGGKRWPATALSTKMSASSASPEFLLGSHERDLVPDGLDEVVVSRDGARHHGELPPVVPHEDGEHGGHLMLQTRRQLQLQPLLGLKIQEDRP